MIDFGIADPELFSAPEPVKVSKNSHDNVVFRITKTSISEEVMVSTKFPIPQDVIDQAKSQGIALFHPSEFSALRQMSDEMKRGICLAKRTFPESGPVRYIPEAVHG